MQRNRREGYASRSQYRMSNRNSSTPTDEKSTDRAPPWLIGFFDPVRDESISVLLQARNHADALWLRTQHFGQPKPSDPTPPIFD